MRLPIYRIHNGTSDRDVPSRTAWSSGKAYEVVRQRVAHGDFIEVNAQFNLSCAISGWNRGLLSEAERAVIQLRKDGLSPRVAFPLRVDVIASDLERTARDFPWEILAKVEDVAGYQRRFWQAYRDLALPTAAGKLALPLVANGMGLPDVNVSQLSDHAQREWQTRCHAEREGVFYKAAEHLGAAPLYYLGDHRREQYAPWLWVIRALVVEPRHPHYLEWLVECAKRLHTRITNEWRGLAEFEFSLHAKERHYETDEEGNALAPPITEFGPTDFSSGLIDRAFGWESDLPGFRVAGAEALLDAGVPSVLRFWAFDRDPLIAAAGSLDWTT